jgi:hypothetical protein
MSSYTLLRLLSNLSLPLNDLLLYVHMVSGLNSLCAAVNRGSPSHLSVQERLNDFGTSSLGQL